MNCPRISIITPTLNAAATIRLAIESVSAQNYQNIEHIILDGKSVDQTLSTVESLQRTHSHLRVISERDSGLYNAMNKGLRLSTGDWIYFMGSDDTFFSSTVLSELLAMGAFEREAVVYGNVQVLGNASWAKHNEIYDGPFPLKKLLSKNICHQAIFYPRSVVDKVGLYNESYNVCADWDYNLRCYANADFSYVDKMIADFTAGGYSTRVADKFIAQDFMRNVFEYFRIDPYAKEHASATSPFSEIIARYHAERPSMLSRLRRASTGLVNQLTRKV